MPSFRHSLCCESLPEERSAGNPHATFCGNRWRVTATDDPMLRGKFPRSTHHRLHHVRDMAYDEDRCRARKGNSPRALACLRNFSISLLRLHHVPNIKAALRDLAAQADKVLEMLGL